MQCHATRIFPRVGTPSCVDSLSFIYYPSSCVYLRAFIFGNSTYHGRTATPQRVGFATTYRLPPSTKPSATTTSNAPTSPSLFVVRYGKVSYQGNVQRRYLLVSPCMEAGNTNIWYHTTSWACKHITTISVTCYTALKNPPPILRARPNHPTDALRQAAALPRPALPVARFDNVSHPNSAQCHNATIPPPTSDPDQTVQPTPYAKQPHYLARRLP